MKARIDVFIKIVGNIANSQTNILRIRTLVVMFDDVKVDVRIELLMIQSLCISSMTNVLLKLHVPLIIDFILNDRDFFTIICLHVSVSSSDMQNCITWPTFMSPNDDVFYCLSPCCFVPIVA